MYRRSTYTIEIGCGPFHVWINSLTGAIDRLPSSFIQFIREGIVDISPFESIFAALIERGHITSTSVAEEKELALRAWSAMDGVHRQSAKIVICPSIDCNFRCGYCFESALQKRIDDGDAIKRQTHMSAAQVEMIFSNLDNLKDINESISDHITLFGGEPLWKRNKDVVSLIVGKAKERNFSLSAISNGYNLSDFRDLLGKDGISKVQISLDGPAELHDSMRPLNGGGGTFDRIIQQVLSVVDVDGLEIDIRTNYDGVNLERIPELYEYLLEIGLISRPNINFHANLISLNHAKQGKDYATVKKYKSVADKVPDIELDCFTSGLKGTLVSSLQTGDPMSRRAHFCSATSGMYVFSPDNSIYSCWEGIGEAHSRIATYDSNGISWIKPTLNMWHARTAPHMEKCQKCSHLFFCGGGCAVHAIEQSGDITKSQCDGIKKKFSHMVKGVMKTRYPEEIT